MQAIIKTVIQKNRSNFKAYVVLGFVTLSFLTIALIGRILITEVNQAYTERLKAGLSTFEIILTNKLGLLNRELSRMANDDALKVTLALDMHAQIRHYLAEEFQGSGLDFIQILSASGEVNLAEVESKGGVAPARQVCSEDYRVLIEDAGKVFLMSQSNVVREGENLALICGGIELGSNELMAYFREVLAAQPFLVYDDGRLLLLNDKEISLSLPENIKNQQLFSPVESADNAFGMVNQLDVGRARIKLGLIIEKKQVRDGVINILRVLFLGVLLVGAVGYFAYRNYIAQRRVQSELHLANKLTSITLASIGDSVITTDTKGWVSYMNDAAVNLTGLPVAAIEGKPWNSQIKLVEKASDSSMDPVMASISLKRTIRSAGDTNLVTKQGETAVQFMVAPIFDEEDVSGSVVILHNTSQERKLRDELVQRVNTDELTGLMNRSAFCQSVESALKEVSYSETEHALLFLDLDRFKAVNDSCGHQAGDLLLKQLTTMIRRNLRDNDIFARLGGDEFGVLLVNSNQENALSVAEKIVSVVGDFSFIHEQKPFSIGVSIGVSMIDAQSTDFESVFHHADASCLLAKEKGRNRVELHASNEAPRTELLEVEWAPQIRDALRRDRLFLYVQPMRPANEVHHREAGIWEVLLRMLDHHAEVVSPAVFLPAAKRYGLMPEIDRWVIENVFKDKAIRFVTRAGDQNGTLSLMSINISSESINQPDFLPFVLEKIKEYRVCPANICFELTETTIATDLDRATQFIKELGGIGCRFMIDDFGVGMTSFNHLKHIKIDFLKIDGSAVKNVKNDPVDRAMVKSVIEIAKTMNIKTVAEFVETDEIGESLTKLGTDYLQGYAIGRPFPLEDFRQRMLRIVA